MWLGANLATDAAVLRPNGVIAAYSSDAEPEPKLPFGAFLRKNARIHTVLVYVMDRAAHEAAIADVVHCLEAGALRHRIGRHYPLESIASAHETVERGQAIGKVVVDIA